jgi:hypothetical protein
MSGFRAAAIMMVAGASLAFAPSAHASRVGTRGAACRVAKALVATRLHRPLSGIPFCEALRVADSPRGFYILALRGRCREDICGSTLIGWYAVQKRTGRVFEWEVGEWRLGASIPRRP